MNELATITSADSFRQSTDAAGMCREIVLKTATKISGRRYVTVEGWQAIAIAHGCTASADYVERVLDEGATGFKATGIIRRMSDGAEIARAEGFLGDDEQMWAKRPVYARRAMVQTRAISRACRSAFAHVVVMMDAGLMTTPAEEIPHDPETGEIIDAPLSDKPVPGITKIKQRLRAMQVAGDAPDITAEQFRQLKRENREDLKAIRDANHLWWTGGGDVEGFGPWMERRLAEIEEDDGTYRQLLDSLTQCDTKPMLENWRIANEELIETLDGAQSRSFQLAYDLQESNINEMDKVRAG